MNDQNKTKAQLLTELAQLRQEVARLKAVEADCLELLPGDGQNPTAQENLKEIDYWFTLSLDMLCIAGTDGYFKQLNPAFEKTLGWTGPELQAKPFLDFVHLDDVPATLAEIEKLAQGEPTIYFENRYRCQDGSYKWLAWTAQPTPAGTLYAIARDVTRQKQSEAALDRRLRGLDSLNRIGREIAETPAIPDLLEWVAAHIPPATQYPDLCRAAIEYNGQLYGAAEVLELPDQITNALWLGGQSVGRIYLAYTKKYDFLDEESALLGGIASRISAYIENRRLVEQLQQRATELEETTAMLDSFLENTPIMTVIKDAADLRFVRWNKAAEKIVGYDRKDLIGKNDYDLFPKDEADFFTAKDREVLAGGELVDIPEEPIQTAAGEIRFLHTQKLPIYGADGQPKYLMAVCEDISERKRAEMARRESERQYQQILDAITDMILVKGPHSRIIWANKAFRDQYGMTNEQLRDMIDAPFVEPDYTQQYVKDDAYVFNTGQVLNIPEEPVTRYDGRVLTVHTVKSPIVDAEGKIVMTVGVSRDIGERKQAEQTVRQNEALLRTIIDTTPDWIFIKDREHRYRLVNQGYANSLHMSPEDFIGKNDLDLGFPEDIVKGNPEKGIRGFWADDREVMDSGQLKLIEIEPAVVDGQSIFLRTRKVPLRDTAGNVWGVLGFVQDITASHLAQEALAKRATELETVAQVNVAVSTILDTQELLQRVVDLTKVSFNLYHAHIYLLNETGDTLILAAGAGKIGSQMVAQKWSISLEREHSLVAQAARTRQGVTVNDVRENPDFLPNPLLPNTRAEMAIPIMIGEQVLGVLDVQADVVGYFTVENVHIKSILAGQLAVALRNAQLYQKTETALASSQQSQELLRSVIDAAPDWIYVKDREYRYRLVNQSYARALRLSPEDFIGKDDLEMGFPEDTVKGDPEKGVRGFWVDDGQVMDSGEPLVNPHVPVTLGGAVHIFHDIKSPLHDTAGTIWGVLGLSRDVTELQQIQKALQEAQERTQTILAYVSVPMLISRVSDGKIIYANTPLAEMVVVPMEDLIDKQTPDFYLDIADRQTVIGQVIRQGYISNYELQLKRSNGESFWGLLTARLFSFQGENAIITTLIDITDRKQIEEELRANQERLSEVLAVAQLANWEFDVSTQMFTFNDQFYALFRTTAEREGGYFMPAMVYAQKFVHPDDVHMVGAEIQKAIEMPDASYAGQVEHRFIRADGSEGYMVVQSRVIKDEQGRTIRTVGASQDITERKQAELEQDRLLAEIEATYRQFVQREWSQFLGEQHGGRWHIEHHQVELAAESEFGETDKLHGNGHNGAAISAPIKLRGQTIGNLNLEDIDPNRKWSTEEKALVETISEQLAQTIENLRLFEDTQKHATREQLTREITDKMRASPDIDSIIQIGLTELAKTLNVSRTYVKLTTKSKAEDARPASNSQDQEK